MEADFFKDKPEFKKAMDFVFMAEGGYSNNKYDKGGKTNFGITQTTYNIYRKRKGLELKSVKNITKEEAVKIYYEDYWIASGADKIKDFPLALVLFDSCINHGLTAGLSLYKKSGNDVSKFIELRRLKYKNIVARNPVQNVFYKGWMNRLDNLQNYINCPNKILR